MFNQQTVYCSFVSLKHYIDHSALLVQDFFAENVHVELSRWIVVILGWSPVR